MKGSSNFRTAWAIVLVAGLAAFSIHGRAAEPVSSSYILGKLVPITGQEDRSIDLDIKFDLESAQLTAGAKTQLDFLGQALVSPLLATAQIGIYGHTDASGTAHLNKALSEKRAAAAKSYLLERFAIDPERLITAGYGEEKLKNPANPNGAENRRVEVVNLTGTSSLPTTPTKGPAGDMQAIQ
ncbi:MAG: OmpA family protein [Rhodospirillales bacterium]|nr:OmpA family protein [Rhodospirillales bacterium]